jgi:hypothetical protein
MSNRMDFSLKNVRLAATVFLGLPVGFVRSAAVANVSSMVHVVVRQMGNVKFPKI